MKTKFTLFTLALIFIQISVSAQDSTLIKKVNKLEEDVTKLRNLKISGWVQAQFQVAEGRGAKTFDGGDFLSNQYNRFMIRRGRVKFTYTQKLSQYVLQVNASERGVNLVEIFGKVTDPWTKSISLTAGVLNRPFSFEIQQSSADRETPERSRYIQSLLPNERDLGAMITFQPGDKNKLHGLKFDAGIFSGNGLYVPGTTSTGSTGNTTAAGLVDTDHYKDFMSRLYYKRTLKEDKFTIGIGVSTYQGAIAYQNNKVYNTLITDTASGLKKWQLCDTSAAKFQGNKAPRTYYAGEFQFSVKSKLGTSTIRTEYITGTQSGSLDQNKSPNVTTVNGSNTVSRTFNGGNVYFVQRIAKTKHELAFKYEWYDPNTELSVSDFKTGTSFTSAEIKYTMIGIGYICYWDENVKFMFYYNMVQNEITEGINGFKTDLNDNVLTVRMQYRF
jgi:hypothetical protein